MKSCIFIIFSLLMVASCQKEITEYQPEFQSCAKQIQKRVRAIRPSVLQEFDVLIAEHWEKTAILNCNLCRLEEPYFQPLRIFLEDHEETINRVLERGISKDFEREDNLLIFQYYVIHHLPDIHVRIMEYFDIDLKILRSMNNTLVM